jgi:hypothetical protein
MLLAENAHKQGSKQGRCQHDDGLATCQPVCCIQEATTQESVCHPGTAKHLTAELQVTQ